MISDLSKWKGIRNTGKESIVTVVLTSTLLIFSSISSQANMTESVISASSDITALPEGNDTQNKLDGSDVLPYSTWEEQPSAFLGRNNTNYENIKHVTLVAQDVDLSINDQNGNLTRVPMWTFNGTVPAPPLRFTEGDNITILFINNSTSNQHHTIHFHGDHDERNDGVEPLIAPGENYTYSITAGPPGALMYHCHAPPTSQHIRNGMYGIFIVDPKDKPLLPAREFYLVTSELNPADAMALNPKYYLLNGYYDQYHTYPLETGLEDTTRFYVINMGTTTPCAFHLHSTIFKAYPSGLLANEPLDTQTVLIGPGDASIIEAKWKYPGKYLFHCHGIQEERGNMGHIKVGMQNYTSDGSTHPTGITWNETIGVNLGREESLSMIDRQYELQKRLQTTTTPSNYTSPNLTKSVSIFMNAFDPSPINVTLGTNVTWINNDNAPHTVTSGVPGEPNKLFGSEMMFRGQSFSYVFDGEGTFPYYCDIHTWMRGEVIVESRETA
jgi:FtsP/CotA-like multicopper oxidase with cupredoxin domain